MIGTCFPVPARLARNLPLLTLAAVGPLLDESSLRETSLCDACSKGVVHPVSGKALGPWEFRCGNPGSLAVMVGRQGLSRMNWIELGYAAAFCTTTAYLPPVARVWSTRQCDDVSLTMLLILMSGLALWHVFGLIKSEFSIVAANSVTFLLAGILLTFKLRRRGARPE